MRIAIIGYGKMGKLVEALAVREGWEVGPRLDLEDNRDGSGITRSSMSGVDVAVDFSQPDAVLSNIEAGPARAFTWLWARRGGARSTTARGSSLASRESGSFTDRIFPSA
jgi:hypothetical protein